MRLPEESVWRRRFPAEQSSVETRRPPETLTPPMKVEVPVPPTKSWPAADNCADGDVVPMPRKPFAFIVSAAVVLVANVLGEEVAM